MDDFEIEAMIHGERTGLEGSKPSRQLSCFLSSFIRTKPQHSTYPIHNLDILHWAHEQGVDEQGSSSAHTATLAASCQVVMAP